MVETSTADATSVARGLREWLASDAAQSPTGAFYAWRDEEGRPSFEYPEITGYALTHLAGVADPMGRESAAGHRAARWLMDRIRSGDLSARDSWDGAAVYTFDLGMIASGLMAFGTRHSSEEMTASGVQLALTLQEQIDRMGTLRPLLVDSNSASSRSAWSTEGSAHLLKVVQCLLYAGELGFDSCLDAAATLVELSTELQRADGRFVTHPSDRETMVHPHLYAVEGLWMFGTARNDREALRRARLGTEWVWQHQGSTGSFPRWFSHSNAQLGPAQGDLTAQALRAAILLDVATERQQVTVDWLANSAVWDQDGSAAIPYQPTSATLHRNSWTTLFAAQALAAYRGERISWRSLV